MSPPTLIYEDEIMSIFDRFRNRQQREFFPGSVERPKTPILFSAEKNPTVAACSDKICNTLAKLPLRLYEKTSDGLKIANRHPLHYLLDKLFLVIGIIDSKM